MCKSVKTHVSINLILIQTRLKKWHIRYKLSIMDRYMRLLPYISLAVYENG